MSAKETRIERDSMGEMEVPVSAYYGASTMRAVLNFPISSLRFSREFIQALAVIKASAASTNIELGILDVHIGTPIIQAAKEVSEGKFDTEFVLDIFQTGSGTSTNTNANEVIANRAIEISGGDRGERFVHPNDHVNLCQSSNDVIPSAIHIAAITSIQTQLIPSLTELKTQLLKKSEEFWPIVKTGRTHLQDATPIRLGQEFLGYAGQIERGITRANHAVKELSEIALGGTAVGTGVNSHPQFSNLTCEKISDALDISVHETDNHFQAQNTIDSLVEASGSLRTIAISMNKIANDIRFLGSGPRAGLAEITLPEVQPGSSIMPGKVNPVIAESLIQVVAHVIGNDNTIMLSGHGGYFELNMMFPVAAHNILESIFLLATSANNFSEQCVKGIQATGQGPESVEKGLMLGTVLTPAVGYDKAASIAKEAAATNRTIREVAKETTDLSDSEIDKLLNAEKMTEPGL